MHDRYPFRAPRREQQTIRSLAVSTGFCSHGEHGSEWAARLGTAVARKSLLYGPRLPLTKKMGHGAPLLP